MTSKTFPIVAPLPLADDLDLAVPDAVQLAAALNTVAATLRQEMAERPSLGGLDEGYGALCAEVMDVRAEVKHGTTDGARAAAVRVAVMALRFLVDIPAQGDKSNMEIR